MDILYLLVLDMFVTFTHTVYVKVQLKFRVFLLVLRYSRNNSGPFSPHRRVSRTLVPWWVEQLKSRIPSLARTTVEFPS